MSDIIIELKKDFKKFKLNKFLEKFELIKSYINTDIGENSSKIKKIIIKISNNFTSKISL
tara:strand:+ start:1059 stop:1238 length:180 start_codon:yes stop_codon:yes gene_type:complete